MTGHLLGLHLNFCKKNSFTGFIYMREITKNLHFFGYNNITANPIIRKNKHLQATSLSFGNRMSWTFFFFSELLFSGW